MQTESQLTPKKCTYQYLLESNEVEESFQYYWVPPTSQLKEDTENRKRRKGDKKEDLGAKYF